MLLVSISFEKGDTGVTYIYINQLVKEGGDYFGDTKRNLCTYFMETSFMFYRV